jgi:hypothetical protein
MNPCINLERVGVFISIRRLALCVMFRHGLVELVGIILEKASSPISEREGNTDWASLNIHSNKIEASEGGILNAMRSRMVANEAM